jgi:DNA mismatch endonuclease (patch repair protein)
MAHIRAKDTKPELIVRSMVRRMGYRFRLHRRDLPGTPDLVFPLTCLGFLSHLE